MFAAMPPMYCIVVYISKSADFRLKAIECFIRVTHVSEGVAIRRSHENFCRLYGNNAEFKLASVTSVLLALYA